MRAAECSYDMLGGLTPRFMAESKLHKKSVYGSEPIDLIDENINGIELPPNILLELRMIGYPLMAYNRGELEDAINACSVDKVMLENPDAHNFRDKLKPRTKRKTVFSDPYSAHTDEDWTYRQKKQQEEDAHCSMN